MSNPNSGNTKAPDFAKQYKEGLKTYLEFLPKELQNELAYRQQYDPQFIEQQMALQEQYDPRLAQEQMAALQRRDPQWLATHQLLGDKVQQALQRGYVDPRQEAAYQQYSQMAGKVDPRYEAAYNKLAALSGQADPTRTAEYKALGQQVRGDTLRGTTADPATLRQMTQAILSRQPGLSYGEAQNMAAAVYTGQRGQALQQQRQQAGQQFLQQATPLSQQQQSLGAFTNVLDPSRMSQAELAQFYGQTSPEQNAMALAGTYIQPSNSITGQLNQIPGVQAPRSFGYVNPNAGYQGVQFGLQNYQNMLAQNGATNSGNPWMGALQGAGQGASYGGTFGGGYGAAGGAIIGGIAGGLGYPQYSDSKLKNKITRTGLTTKDGIPISEFSYNGSDKRYRGVIGQDVEKIRPDAVFKMGEYLMVEYHKLGLKLEEVHNG